MASIRTTRIAPLLHSALCRQCSRATARRFPPAAIPAANIRRRAIPPAFTQIRWHSVPASKPRQYDFEQVRKITESPSDDLILIDVREPSEVEAGYIPTAINIPVKSQPDALMLPEEEFEDRFGFAKPDPQKEVVFYCRSGVRSNAAAQLAQQAGYANVAEYRGSWLDWQEKGGPASKP